MSSDDCSSHPFPPDRHRASLYTRQNRDMKTPPKPLFPNDPPIVDTSVAAEKVTEGATVVQAPAIPHPAKPKRDMELWLGRNAIGVLAAGLVLLGIAYFAITLIPQLSDGAKVAVMFALSIGTTVFGSLLTVRKQNGFTAALMGCGAGSLFISILATHLHFNMLAEVPAFTLLLIWMAMCLLLIRKTQSLPLDIVLQLGLAVSVCLGFSTGFDNGRLWLLVGYQLIASFMVVAGNLMFCPKMYRSSLLLALILSFVTSSHIANYCWPITIFGLPRAERPVAFVAVVFFLQFTSATSFAALIAHTVISDYAESTCETENDDGNKKQSFARLMAIMVTTALLWLMTTCADVSYPLAKTLIHLDAFSSAKSSAITIGIACQLLSIAAACRALESHARRHLVRIDSTLISVTLRVLVCCGAIVASCGSLSAYSHDAFLPVGLLWIWALFALTLTRKVDNRFHTIVALTCLVMESVLVSIYLFPMLGVRFGIGFAMVYGAAYAIGLCFLTGWILYQQDWRHAGAIPLAAMGTILVMSYFANCTPLDFVPWVWSICFMSCALIWVALGFVMHHGKLRVCGLVIVLCCVLKLVVLDLAGLDPAAHTIAYIVGGLICFAVSALYNFTTRRLTSQQCG